MFYALCSSKIACAWLALRFRKTPRPRLTKPGNKAGVGTGVAEDELEKATSP